MTVCLSLGLGVEIEREGACDWGAQWWGSEEQFGEVFQRYNLKWKCEASVYKTYWKCIFVTREHWDDD